MVIPDDNEDDIERGVLLWPKGRRKPVRLWLGERQYPFETVPDQ